MKDWSCRSHFPGARGTARSDPSWAVGNGRVAFSDEGVGALRLLGDRGLRV